MFCCGGDESKESKGHGAARQKEDGSFELDKDHATYLANSQAKTAQKSAEIERSYRNQESRGTDEQKATARYWYEFHNTITERLESIRQIGKTEDGKEKEGDDKDKQKEAHDKFIKEMNFELEEPLLRIFTAYSKQDDKGDRKINKEASLRFFDDLVNANGDMCLASAQDYSRYCLKFYGLQDSDMQEKRTQFAADAETAAVKKSKADALEKAIKDAKKDSLAGLERALEAAKEVEADVTEAEAKLKELQEQKEAQDKKDEEKKKKDEEKAAAEKEKRQKDMDDTQKAEDNKKEEEKAATEKEKEEKAKAKKEAAEKAAEEAAEKAGDDEAIKKAARSAADENWLLSVNSHIDRLLADATVAYEENGFTTKRAAFEKFFNGENAADKADYELQRDYLMKVLTVGTGEGFEAFIQSLGFKVVEADCVAEVKKMNETDEKKDEGKKEEKKEEKKEDA